MSIKKYYTGIGSRVLPATVASLQRRIGQYMASTDHILRSGGAKGSDTNFYLGVEDYTTQDIYRSAEIWLPTSKGYGEQYHVLDDDTQESACTFLERTRLYTSIRRRPHYIQRLMARNILQLAGGLDNTTPIGPFSERVFYWAPLSQAGLPLGGTGVTIKIAKYLDIPTYNLRVPKERDFILDYCQIPNTDPW